MKKISLIIALLFLFSAASFGQAREQIVKIKKGKFSAVVSGITNEKNPINYILQNLKAGQTITIRVKPENFVIGLLYEYVEAEAKKSKLIYKVFETQNGGDFQFNIGNGRSGVKYTATVEIK